MIMLFAIHALLHWFSTLSFAAQPNARAPQPAELRELPWGQLNILHTTDTHGWHGGHLLEPSYSADWGDYISFSQHLRKRADKEGVDLLLVDTGDRVEGNGLYDSSEPQGKYTYDIFKQQNIDVICSGNHELYKAKTYNNEFTKTVPNFKGSYLASNLDIRKNNSDEYEALAPRYKTFTTKNQGIKILAFGFIFNFQGSNENARVIPVEDAIKEKWFQDAIREQTDLFLVAGHVPVRSEEFDTIFNAIRSQNFDTPIMFLGGHTHIRDYKKYDSKAYALQSGRYMETIGFASLSGIKPSEDNNIPQAEASLKFKRRYIDSNLFSLHHHSGRNSSTFPTKLGVKVTNQIADAREALRLDDVRGCAPRNLWLNRVKVDNKNSLFNWLKKEVLPDQFTGTGENSPPKLVIANTGSLRFDIFKGPYTRDSSYIISPFTSDFKVIPGVNSSVASKVLTVLNEGAPILQELDPSLDPSILAQTLRAPPAVEFTDGQDTHLIDQQADEDKPEVTPGYTTTDDAGTDGDDTVHSPIKFYSIPNCIQAKVDFPSDEEAVNHVDLVFNEFLEPWVIVALRFLGQEYDKSDVSDALGGRAFTDIIATWVDDHWPCDNKDEL